jgi:hypothetical protein
MAAQPHDMTSVLADDAFDTNLAQFGSPDDEPALLAGPDKRRSAFVSQPDTCRRRR